MEKREKSRTSNKPPTEGSNSQKFGWGSWPESHLRKEQGPSLRKTSKGKRRKGKGEDVPFRSTVRKLRKG